MRQRRALDEGLQRGLAVAVLARVCSFGVVRLDPGIHVDLDFLHAAVQLTPERAGIELVLDCLMEPFADAVGLRALHLRARVIDVFQIQIERELV